VYVRPPFISERSEAVSLYSTTRSMYACSCGINQPCTKSRWRTPVHLDSVQKNRPWTFNSNSATKLLSLGTSHSRSNESRRVFTDSNSRIVPIHSFQQIKRCIVTENQPTCNRVIIIHFFEVLRANTREFSFVCGFQLLRRVLRVSAEKKALSQELMWVFWITYQ